MYRSRTLTIHFTTDTEAKAVHNTLRSLRQHGYTKDFVVFGDYATVNVSPEEADTVLATLEDLRYRHGFKAVWIS